MKLQEENINHIKIAFAKLKSKEDLLALLNYVKVIIYGDKTYFFEISHINFHCNPENNPKRYTRFLIKKKSGAKRVIHSPNQGLKALQKCLNLIFQTIYEPNPAAKGFVPNKSIVDNARVHVGSLYVYNIDLKDFFPSIDQARIWGRLQVPPFNLNQENGRLELANIIASLCCHKMAVERLDEDSLWQKVIKNVLPQGAPTSPTISNIICQSLDYYLNAVAKRFGLKYSRYADDITFSSMHNVYQKNSSFSKEIERIIKKENFHIKESKTRLQKTGFRQEVTGLIVNDKVNVSKRYIKDLRKWLYYWERYGFNKASSYFISDYRIDKGHSKKGIPNMKEIIAGKLDFLKMVKGSENDTYHKLKSRFNKLIFKPELESSNVKVKSNKLPEKAIKKKSFISSSVHNPKLVHKLLSKFESSEGLKYLTHIYDNPNEEFSRESLVEIARKEFEEFDNNEIPISLRQRIKGFAFDKNASWWTINNGVKIQPKLGWSCEEVINWCNNPINKGKHPIEFSLYENSFILPFKQSIQIRNEQLYYIINNIVNKEFDIRFLSQIHLDNSLKGVKFFTNVEVLVSALRYIFTSMKAYLNDSSIIEVKAQRNVVIDNRRYRVLNIIHVNSLCDRTSEESILGGDLLDAKNRLTGLCNWSISARFVDGYFEKKILKDSESLEVNAIEKVEGFTHSLYFYA